jgi:UDP-glucose 4-epimerase
MTSGRQTALVTGGAGFIGSHMADLLIDRGYRVRIIDNLVGGREANIAHHRNNPDLTFAEADIRNLNPGDKLFTGVDCVFHFAGIGDIVPSINKPLEYMSVNVQGTVHMTECARQAGVRKFVYAASSSCYGLAKTPTREDHPIDPQYPYALSKYQGEQAAFHWRRVYRLPVNSIRIFNAYGTRSRTSGAYGAVFGVFLRQKLAGQPFTVVGDGTQTRDFLYATDVAEAFLAAAETDKVGEIWNLGAGDPQSVNRLVELLGGEVVYIPKRPGEPDVTHADIGKIMCDLGWRQKVSFADGVARIVADIDYWRDAPLWTPDTIAAATANWFNALGAK